MDNKICEELNEWADLYLKSRNVVEKRDALIRYLLFLEMAAAGHSYAWSAMRAGMQDDLGELGKRVYPDGTPPFWNLRPAQELSEALAALQNGEKPALLAPSKVSGAPKKSREEQYRLATAAALITILMQVYGMTEEYAAKRVVDGLRRQKLPVPKGKTLAWKALQAWRDKIAHKTRMARQLYKVTIEIAGSIDPNSKSASELIDDLLNPNTLPGVYFHKVRPMDRGIIH